MTLLRRVNVYRASFDRQFVRCGGAPYPYDYRDGAMAWHAYVIIKPIVLRDYGNRWHVEDRVFGSSFAGPRAAVRDAERRAKDMIKRRRK